MTPSRTLVLSVLAIGLFHSSARSQDYHWRRASTLPNVPWHSVAFNPLSHGRIVFAGSAGMDGVYRSDDGGLTWAEGLSPADAPLSECRQIFCVPNDTNIVLAVTTRLLYRSTDGGKNWVYFPEQFGGSDGEVIAYHPSDDVLYYGDNIAKGFWKSGDHGASWQKTGQG